MSYRDDQGQGYIPAEDNTLHHFKTSPANIGLCALTHYQRHNTDLVQTRPTSCGNDFMAVMNATATPRHRGWINEREISVGASRPGQFRLCDMRDAHMSELSYSFHSIHLFLPNTAFCTTPNSSIKWNLDTVNPVDDDILWYLVMSLSHATNQPVYIDQLLCDCILVSISRHILKRYALIEGRRSFRTPRLDSFQEKKVKDLMISRLFGNISLEEIATTCELSIDQFGRAFKNATGISPYRWLTNQRVDKAKDLLRGSGLSIVEIALRCGFSNQSHFTRIFTNIAGQTPGRWRRQLH